MSNKPIFDYPLFAMGFRVFFALAGLSALALIALWNAISNGSLHIDNYFLPSNWHGHEMLLGYATAVIAGFLLTAVKNWTGIPPVTSEQLAWLSLLWVYGRVVPFYSELLPDVLIAVVDFSFLPCLAFYVAKPILHTGAIKNLLFPSLLLLMALGNGMIHAQILGITASGIDAGFNLVVTIIIMMILVIAGRIFPFFTERGMSGVICIRNPVLDGISIVLSLMTLLIVIFGISGSLLVIAATSATVINIMRIAGWFDRRILFVPLLWVLYVGYGWIIFGFAMLALTAFAWVPQSLAIHAFTVGGIGVLTLGMMARVALGHTGRALKASNIIAIAFVLLNIAVLFRVLFPALLPNWYNGFVVASTYSWLAGFSLFVFYYAPILTTPRIDGEKG